MFENKRLEKFFKNLHGRRLLIATGIGTKDIFYINEIEGAQSLVYALQKIALQKKYDFVFSIKINGETNFANPDMQNRFEEATRGQTKSRAGENTTKTFIPNSRMSNNKTNSINSEIEEVSSNRLSNLLSKVIKLFKNNYKVFAIFENPEELWQSNIIPNEVVDSLKKILTLASLESDLDSKIVCIVKPSRKDEFIALLDRLETNEPFRETITLSEPDKQEILAYLERICRQNNIKGDKEKSAEMVNAKKWLLYHVHSSILNEIKKSEEQRKLEAALTDGAPKENLDEVLKEIDSLIGLQSVKLRVKDFINLAKSYNPSNKSGMPNTHMLFLGNPGTGKTVVARLIARLLNALGLRSSGEIVEVSLSDISSQYNSGECIEKMNNFISKAMGGVLFIDEAYQLADDQWASKTLGILLKEMEDKREFLTVIFAGYEREMEKIWENNPGFKSRIPESNWFYFKDYSAEELIEISRLNLKNKKYTFNEDFAKALSDHIKTQTKRRFYKSGRDIRNLIENIERSMLQKSHSEPQVDDIPEVARFNENIFINTINKLKEEYPGWNNLYEFLEKTALRAENAEENNNLIDISTLHCRFIGNPGTGKTTAARHLGEIFKSMGILSNGKLLETNPMKDFVSQYQGGTAKLVRDNFERAKGGILFIDEAYQFSTISGGQEVVHQIVQTLTAPDFSDTLVIMAGYRHEMIELMKVNPGLESRLPVEIAFENMSIETLLKLFHKKIDEKNLVIRNEDEETIDRLVSEKISIDQYDSKYANVRSLNSFVESIIERQLLRIKKTKDLEKYRIKPCDISDDYNTNTASEIDEALKELNTYVGLEKAKNYIKVLVNKRNRDKARGITNEKPIRLIFSGNPGTGKTSVARVFARIFKKLGLIPRGDLFCETRGIELQASYEGQTQQKIKDLFENNKNGTIFIDEVYALASSSRTGGTFSQQAIDTLLGLLDLPEYSKTAVIVSGYRDKLNEFLACNEGLSRRFYNTIEFKDFSFEQCLEILLKKLDSDETILDTSDINIMNKLEEAFREAKMHTGFGNAGSAIKLADKLSEKCLEYVSDPSSDLVVTEEILDETLSEWLDEMGL